MKALLMILASEFKCEFIEFTDDSKLDSTVGKTSRYHGRIIRLKEEKNRSKKKFRMSGISNQNFSNELEAFCSEMAWEEDLSPS